MGHGSHRPLVANDQVEALAEGINYNLLDVPDCIGIITFTTSNRIFH